MTKYSQTYSNHLSLLLGSIKPVGKVSLSPVVLQITSHLVKH